MFLACELLLSTSLAQWQPHDVRLLASPQDTQKLPAQFQMVTESWNRVVAAPYLVYMPKKDRMLLLVGCDYPHRAHVLWSDDRGKTWDLDHRYILHSWATDKKLIWWPSSQATSSVLLPDGSIMTAFGTGYRCKPGKKPHTPAPRDVGLVHWRTGGKPRCFGGPITSAAINSDLRNFFDPPE